MLRANRRSGASLLSVLRTGIACAVAAGALALPSAASANSTGGFERFCDEWMGKLAARERDNQNHAKAQNAASGVVVEYTGYTKVPVSCTARTNAKGVPSVGILVYHELRYRKSGSSPEQARTSTPAEVERVEVTEVFRYDGSKWTY